MKAFPQNKAPDNGLNGDFALRATGKAGHNTNQTNFSRRRVKESVGDKGSTPIDDTNMPMRRAFLPY